MEFSNSMYDLGSPISAGPLHVVQLSEDLRLALELQPSQEERDSLRAQIPTETAQALIDWLQSGAVCTLCFHSNNLPSHIFFYFLCCSVQNSDCGIWDSLCILSSCILLCIVQISLFNEHFTNNLCLCCCL